jgi:hypothetical protein
MTANRSWAKKTVKEELVSWYEVTLEADSTMTSPMMTSIAVALSRR